MNPLNPDTHDPIAELRDELARVSVSEDFVGRVRERLADDLEPLRAELVDLTVSPEFAVRVREGIERAADRRSAWRFTWRWLMPAAGLAAAAMVVVLWPRNIDGPGTGAVADVARVEPVAAPAVTSSSPQVTPPATAAPRPRTVAAARTVASPVSPSPRDPFLEVITDQPELLRGLQISIERPDVAVDATEPSGTFELPKLEVPKVQVDPISLFVVPNSRLPVGVSPFILRIPADSAERSSK